VISSLSDRQLIYISTVFNDGAVWTGRQVDALGGGAFFASLFFGDSLLLKGPTVVNNIYFGQQPVTLDSSRSIYLFSMYFIKEKMKVKIKNSLLFETQAGTIAR
jgi:hypothetical protein